MTKKSIKQQQRYSFPFSLKELPKSISLGMHKYNKKYDVEPLPRKKTNLLWIGLFLLIVLIGVAVFLTLHYYKKETYCIEDDA